MTPLREIDDGLWVQEAPLAYMGLEVGRIMNVVELGDGGLFVHSPSPLSGDVRAALDALGEVRFVAAPNPFHGHMSMGQYAEAYPGAELLAGPGLARRRQDLEFAAELGERPDPRWSHVLDQAPFRGKPRFREIFFLHRPSRTLIAGDVALHLGAHNSRTMQLLARAGLMHGRLRPTPWFRMTMRDRSAARTDIRRILAWDFDRVIPGHGPIWETGGREELRREWSRLLP